MTRFCSFAYPLQRALAFTMILGAASSATMAASDAPALPPTGWSVGLFSGKALNHNLVDVLPKAASGDLDLRRAYLDGVVVRRALPTPEWLAGLGQWADMPVGSSLEVDLLKGRGLVDNTELVVDWRPAIRPWRLGPVTVELAWSIGYSHAFGAPWTDYVQADKPGGYRDLFHMAPEIALIPNDAPDWSLGLRIHHRSGIYGLVAPRRVGSNHLAVELVRSF